MRRIYLLAALVAPLIANSALAAQALAVSTSVSCSRSYAVAINAANRDEAKRRALAECRDVTGQNDCQIILENNSPGYGALYAAIVSDRECYVSALTGFASRDTAHDATLADCKKYYGVSSCTPLNDWRETGASNSPSVVRVDKSVAVAKAAPTPSSAPVEAQKPGGADSLDEAIHKCYFGNIDKIDFDGTGEGGDTVRMKARLERLWRDYIDVVRDN